MNDSLLTFSKSLSNTRLFRRNVRSMTKKDLQIKGVMLDWAGTTIDFGSLAPAEVFIEVFHRAGVPVTTQEARAPMGMAKRAHIAAVLELPRVKQAWQSTFGKPHSEEDIDRLYAEFIPLQKSVLAKHSNMIPGAVDVVDRLAARGIRIASSTGYTRELMEVVSAEAAKQGYRPEVVLCAEDARAGRPAPWMIFRAAEMLDVYPLSQWVVVDDTAVGVQAGVNAGAWTVGIAETGNSMGLTEEELRQLPSSEKEKRKEMIREQFKQVGADYVIDSIAELDSIIEDINQRLSIKLEK